MTNTRTTETNYYPRALVALAVLATVAAMLLAAPPAHAASKTFLVTFTGDQADMNVGDGICDISAATSVDCTLRAAIQEANSTPDADTIDFEIPAAFGDSNTGVMVFKPASNLPAITAPVTIDGYTQPGASPNTLAKGTNAAPKIALDGTNISDDSQSHSGLTLQGSSGSVIRGLVINRFDIGIDLEGGTRSNRIEGNFVGTDPTGTQELGNSNGVVLIEVSGNTIGGTTPAARNIISGNGFEGIAIANGGSNKVVGNLIGTNASGTGDLGNDFRGVFMVGDFGSGNRIGDGTTAGSNTIAFNAVGIGAAGDSVVGNPISGNSIFSNATLGIDLLLITDTGGVVGVTPNDGDNPNTQQVDPDSDIGANNLQNFPVLTSAATSSTATTVKGKLNSTPDVGFTVEFFSNPSGGNEGKTFIGRQSVTTDAKGNASFSFKPRSRVAVGQAITATATDASGNTSEFSAPRSVAKLTAPKVQKVSPTENATGVSPTVNISAVFSQAMNSSTINATTFKLKKAGTTRNVSARVSYDAAAKKATLNPSVNLTRGAKYVATVTTGAKDLAGNALDQDAAKTGNQPKVWSFTVRR